MIKKKNLYLNSHEMAIGDKVVLTGVIRDIKKLYDWIDVDVHSYYPEILENNPYITIIPKDTGNCNVIKILHSDILLNRNSMDHYSTVLNKVVSKKLQLEINQTSIYPEIYLTDEEKDREKTLQKFGICGKYVLFNCGFKNDIPLKQYPIFHWEKIIKELTKRKIQLIQIGSKYHNHTEFKDIKSLIGKTENYRDFLSLCYHAEASINHMTANTHIMAAFRKPCFTILGGRENKRFESYPNQQIFSTVGNLDCCKRDGCYLKQRNECKDMVGNFPYPKCMTQIDPNIIIKTIVNYL